MKRICVVLLGAVGLGLLAPPVLERIPMISSNLTASANSAATFPPGTFFSVDTANVLRHYNVATPGVSLGMVTVSGLQAGENLLGIDFRPATGQLYGIGSTSRVYIVNPVTGVASPVDGGFSPALSGTDFGVDFNPQADRIRVVSDAEQNLRINPDTGAVVQPPDTNLSPAGNVTAAAYTNNFAGTTQTTLYVIDSDADRLLIQNPPNDGTLTPVGLLGVDTSGLTGFDIATGSGIAYASVTAPAATTSSLYTINLATGAATLVGAISGGANPMRDIALVTGPETVFALTSGNNLVRFNSNAPGTIVGSTPITGLQPAESLVGMDFRPATGQLYGVGSTSRLYIINTANGVATQVGTGTFTTPLNGTDFGVDFNPQVDRLRIVSDAEQNLRINPNNAAVVPGDLPLTPAGNVVAAAYVNNFAGTTSTTLYDIDSNSDLLLIQNPPNDGVLSAVGPLNVNTTGLTGFDIAPTGMAFASLTAPAATSTSLYTVNLATGGATLVGAIGGGETIRDVAIRVCTEVVYGVTQTSGGAFNLINFNAATPGIILSTVAISGLQPAETIVGADFRPATGRLYAIGSTSRVYIINLATGAATAVGAGTPFTPALNGTAFGVDFNPQADRIRIVSDAEQNLRIVPNTGAVVAPGDTNLTPVGNVVAAAYTNNFAGASSTTLFDIDSVSDSLLIQNPPNDGTLTAVGPLGVDISAVTGFDIASGSGIAYVSAYPGAATQPTLYTQNLGTGALTAVGALTLPAGETLVDISVQITAIAGIDSPGVYNSATASWFLRNSNSAGVADLTFTFGGGGPTMIPIKGDWDGDGDDTPGLYDTTTGAFFLRNSNAAGPAEVAVFTFGAVGATFVPLSGDWDGDGDDTIGIYDSATGNVFLKNTNTAGLADVTFTFGAGGAIPITGDWNSDNVDTIGLYVASTGTFFLRNSNSNGPADIPAFSFGGPNNTPLSGDWNGDGADSVGIYNSASGTWFLANAFTGGPADITFGYGPTGVTGFAGDWDGQ